MTTMTRRSLVTASIAAAVAAPTAKLASSVAHADTHNASETGQAPFYRTRLGSAQITIVSDGTIAWEPNILWAVEETELDGFLSRFHQPTESVRLQLNTMVVDMNGRRILVDAGDAAKWQPTGGRLAGNLQAAGIDPGSVDTVVFTHLHPDHLWGVTDADNENLIFPNAEYVVAEPELAFWDNPDFPDHWPHDMSSWLVQTNRAHIEKIRDRISTVGAAAEALPGITFMPTPGHTPGHVSIMLESDGETLLSSGDLFADPLIGFERPQWNWGIDIDAEQGTASRLAFLDQAATDGARVFGFHLPWPGFGYVARDGEAYRWVQERWAW